MRALVALLLVASFYAQVNTQRKDDSIWALSRRSLKIDSDELEDPLLSNEKYENVYQRKLDNHPHFKRLLGNPYSDSNEDISQNVDNKFARRFMPVGLMDSEQEEDYDFEEEEEEDEEKSFRHGGKNKKKKKKKKGGADDDSEEIKKAKIIQKYVPPFWFGNKKKQQSSGWGVGHVEQIGWIIPKDANPGGWGLWPSGWTSGSGLNTGDLKYVDGKGWEGTVGAPWKQSGPHKWGPGYVKKEDTGKKRKKKKKSKAKRKKDKKKRKRRKKNPDPCGGGGGGKKGRSGRGHGGHEGGGGGGGGWMGGGMDMMDPCDKGPKPWFGYPEKIKFVPPPPKGSQIWLKSHNAPHPQKSGWSDYHGWNWKNKLATGWGVGDLVGVVHL